MGMLTGIKNFYYAIQTKDDATGVAYSAPVAIPGLNKFNVTRKTNRDTFYADNQAWETATSKDVSEVEITMADIPTDVLAALLGQTMVGAERRVNAADVAPIVAIGCQSTKTGGSKWKWLYGGQFEANSESEESKGSSLKLVPTAIKGTFLGHKYDGATERVLESTALNYIAGQESTFFNSPLATADVTVPTATIVPLNAATGVAAATTVVWTFNEAIQYSTVTADNFMLITDTTGAKVAGTLAVNAGRTVVTFTPSANLTTATAYKAIATSGVKDLSGNALAPMITKFTVA